MTTQDDKNLENENKPTLEDIEASMEQEMNAVEEAEQAVNAGFAAAQKELNDLKEALARSQADYRNLLSRVDRERDEMGGYITGNVIMKMLPIIDNLERALTNIPADIAENAWVSGMRSIHALAIKQLELIGVKPFDSVGSDVDANLHDVMSQAPGKEGIIVAEFERGYKLGDRVIRHAKVIVGNGAE
jgi:molecular chaperone GrpE